MYETATTRQFREARTETVRSCSIEAADFVKEMVHRPANVRTTLTVFKLGPLKIIKKK
jgi:Choline/Carnitine o-acyltransferase